MTAILRLSAVFVATAIILATTRIDESSSAMDPYEPDEQAEYHDYIVVGAGPAGLQMGFFLDRAGRDYLVLERGPGAGNLFHIIAASPADY